MVEVGVPDVLALYVPNLTNTHLTNTHLTNTHLTYTHLTNTNANDCLCT